MKKIGVIASNKNKQAIEKLDLLVKKYSFTTKLDDVDLIVVIGGDGFMLHCLHNYDHVPLYGINFGLVGFLMNQFDDGYDLRKEIEESNIVDLYPLKMTAIDNLGSVKEHYAINEVSILRQTYQAANIKITINDKVRINRMVADGILVATEAGSTAYNLSAGGSIIPLGSNLMSLVPISVFRPRNWKGVLLPKDTKICFEVIDIDKRPCSATADYFEVRNVTKIDVIQDYSKKYQILFNNKYSLQERIISEQFL